MKLGGLGAAAAAAIGSTGCDPVASGSEGESGDDWCVDQALDLEEATITGLSESMAAGERTSVESGSRGTAQRRLRDDVGGRESAGEVLLQNGVDELARTAERSRR